MEKFPTSMSCVLPRTSFACAHSLANPGHLSNVGFLVLIKREK